MTTIQSIPDEILLTIFEQLDANDRFQCQKVCRSWYNQGHIAFLNQVDLSTILQVEKFIASIDYNPKPSYLNAVKTIRITELDAVLPRGYPFDNGRYEDEDSPSEEEDDYYEDDDMSSDEDSSGETSSVEEPSVEATSVESNPVETPSATVASNVPPSTGIPIARRRLDEENFSKLFFRFTNLQHVHIHDSVSLFDKFDFDTMCDMFLRSCPKLMTFDVSSIGKNTVAYYVLAWKLRKLLTKFTATMYDQNKIIQYGTPVQFFTSFPRLQDLEDWSESITSFEGLFPVLEQSNIRSITSKVNDKENFAEQYLETKSKEEQEQLLEKLSQIKDLDYHPRHNRWTNSIKFISKYLAGLETFSATVYGDNKHWTGLQEGVVIDHMLDILCRVKNHGFVYFSSMYFTDLPKYLPMMLQKIFQSTNERAVNRILQLEITSRGGLSQPEDINMEIKTNQRRGIQQIEILVCPRVNLEEIRSCLFDGSIQYDEIDTFVFELDKTFWKQYRSNAVDYVNIFDKFFEKLPNLKELIMDVPEVQRVTQLQSQLLCKNGYPLVKKVTLHATTNAQLQPLLERYHMTFPNMNHLSLYNYCGVWNDDSNEFEINLAEYTLETLTIDLAPAEVEFKKRATPSFKEEERFFLVKIKSNDDSYMFKVSSNLSSITKMNESDLEKFTLGDGGIQVEITVAKLQYLEVCKFQKRQLPADRKVKYYKFIEEIYKKRLIKLK